MTDVFGIKGSVRKLEQRKQRKQDPTDSLGHVRDLDSYDVEFSPSGQVLLETWYTYSGSECRRTRFEYSEAGRLIRTVSFDSRGAILGSSEHAYEESRCVWVRRDSQGVITSHGIDDYRGSVLLSTDTFDSANTLKRARKFEYSDSKLVKSVSLYYLPDGTPDEHQIDEYDSEGRIQRTYGLKADGSPLGDGKYLHEYDNEGRPSKIWTFSEFSSDNIATSVEIYEYVNDDVGNWIERHEYHLWRSDSYRSESLTTRTLAYYGDGAR